MKTLHKLSRGNVLTETAYTLDDDGTGTIVSSAYDLDLASDRVAQDIGFPIDHGEWSKASRAVANKLDIDLGRPPMTVDFEINEHALEAWRAERAAERAKRAATRGGGAS